MKQPIPYGRQSITDEDVEVVVDTLRSDFLTQGPKIQEFEKKFAYYVDSKYAVAVSNGTAALHLSCIALGVKEGQKVITTPITFAASANSVLYCGAEVHFVDIDPKTYLLDLDKLEYLLNSAPKSTYAGIIVVDFAGLAIDTERLNKIVREHKMWIIEDACHAPGGYYRDSSNRKIHCGSNQYTDLSCFSFHPVKHIACGEGGMITTNDERLYKKLLGLRTHGMTKDTNHFVNDAAEAGGEDYFPNWYMEMHELGYNYRITDIQSALGISQLSRAAEGIKRRREIAEQYFKSFEGQHFIKGQSGFEEGHAYHLYVIEVDDRIGLYNYLREYNIYAQIHYFPCHLMPYYKQYGWKKGDLPYAEAYYSRCISLPMFQTLKDDEIDYVIKKVKSFYAE